MIALVDLDQLIGRPRPETFPLGLRHIGIVELALEPQRRGERALARRLDPRLQRAAAFASGGRFGFSHAETQVKCQVKRQTSAL